MWAQRKPLHCHPCSYLAFGLLVVQDIHYSRCLTVTLLWTFKYHFLVTYEVRTEVIVQNTGAWHAKRLHYHTGFKRHPGACTACSVHKYVEEISCLVLNAEQGNRCSQYHQSALRYPCGTPQ
jgi:hypothetical protein